MHNLSEAEGVPAEVAEFSQHRRVVGFGIAAPAWLFDVAENITHFHMAGVYPKRSSFALKYGPFFTGAKWTFAILPLPMALAGFLFRFLHAE